MYLSACRSRVLNSSISRSVMAIQSRASTTAAQCLQSAVQGCSDAHGRHVTARSWSCAPLMFAGLMPMRIKLLDACASATVKLIGNCFWDPETGCQIESSHFRMKQPHSWLLPGYTPPALPLELPLGAEAEDGSSLDPGSFHPSDAGSAVPNYPPHWLQRRKQFRGGSLLVMLRPGRLPDRLANPHPELASHDGPARLHQSLPQPGSPPTGVCYHYSAQPSLGEAGLAPAIMSKLEGCT